MGRGLAAVAVAAFHMAIIIPAGSSLLSRMSQHGNAGVDFFFVLSGFIMMHAHNADASKPQRLPRFFWKRFVRIYPVYWIFTATTVAMALATKSQNHIKLPSSAIGWIECVTLFRVNSAEMPIVASWTLFYEIVFYLIFSIFLTNRNFGNIVFLFWGCALLFIGKRAEILDPLGPWASRMCLNFLLGILAYHFHKRAGFAAAITMFISGILTFIVAGTSAGAAPEYAFSGLVALASTLTIAGGASIEKFREVDVGPYKILGDASYTIYLAHGHIEPAISRIISKFIRNNGDLLFLFSLSSTLAACILLHFIFEKPILTFAKNFRFRTDGWNKPTVAVA
jgi:peptidoglycan/LPS O-acetylase OafA/YrhL